MTAPRHNSQDQHRNEQPPHTQVKRNTINQREVSIPEYNNRTANPVHQLKRNKHLPRMPLYLRVRKLVQRDELIAKGAGDRGGGEEPAAEVEEAGEPADNAAVAWAGGDGGPVVDTAGGGDSGDQLRKGGGDKGVEYCD